MPARIIDDDPRLGDGEYFIETFNGLIRVRKGIKVTWSDFYRSAHPPPTFVGNTTDSPSKTKQKIFQARR